MLQQRGTHDVLNQICHTQLAQGTQGEASNGRVLILAILCQQVDGQ
jgi:hypothetical protein